MISSNAVPYKKADSLYNDNTSEYSQCKKCFCLRPQRAHHCKECNQCIRKMDHHCIWIANCVGEVNEKAFILVLFYMMVGNFISSCCLYMEYSYIINNRDTINKNENLERTWDLIKVSMYYTMPILGFLMSFAAFMLITVVFINQVNGLTFGMTIIEWKIYPKKYECPFFENNLYKHFLEVFGNKWYIWWIPTSKKLKEYNYMDISQEMN